MKLRKLQCLLLLIAFIVCCQGSRGNGQEAFPAQLSVDAIELSRDNLGSTQRQEIFLRLIENFVGWTEHSRKFVESDDVETGGGYFEAAGAGVNWQRGNGNLCLGYALLLAERPKQQRFSIYKIPRAQIEDHFRRALRTVCISNKNSSRYKSSDHSWGGPSWQSSLPMIGIAWASHVGKDQLDSDTLELVKGLICAECDHLEKPIPSGKIGNTRAEDCAWNSPLLAFACNRYPEDARAARWDELSKQWAINAMSTHNDTTSNELVDDRPLSQWVVSQNVHPDLTIENHNMWSVGYQCTSQHFGEGALAYQVFGKKMPEAFSFRAERMWTDVTRALFLWDGDLLFPHGQDWSWKTYSSIEYLCWLHCCQGNSDAGAYESRALQMIYRRQLAIGTGDLGAAYSRPLNFGNQTVKPKRWAFCYLMHKHFDEPEPISFEKAEAHSHKVYIFPHTKTAIHRAPEKCVSVSWHPDRHPVFVLPEGNTTFSDPPFFFPYDRNSGAASVGFVPCRVDGVTTSRQTQKHPSQLLTDYDPNTYWVGSNGINKPGDGPTGETPIWIQLDFESESTFDSLLIRPRRGFGPQNFDIQAAKKDDGQFVTLKSFEAANHGQLQLFKFPETKSASFRVLITSSFDTQFPDNSRNVQVCGIELLSPGATKAVETHASARTSNPVLLEASATHDGQAMRVRYVKNWPNGIEQFVTVWSLADESTVYATEFRSRQNGQAVIQPLFPIHISAPPGFGKEIVQFRGANWLNLSDHFGVISTHPIPESTSKSNYAFSEKQTVDVVAGKPFGTSVFIVSCGQSHEDSEKLAASIEFIPRSENEPATLVFRSSSGQTRLPIELSD